MLRMSRIQKARNIICGLGALGSTVAIFATVLEQLYGDPEKNKFKSQLKAETKQWNPQQFPKWDQNWDQREPVADPNNNVKLPTASRHLILIRHGQYNLAGETDEERYLTTLGREQARLAGLRLAELSPPFTSMARSNMTRALETA